MISIQQNDNRIKINNLGFITHWSSFLSISESHPIYLVLFEEYSRINPFCQPLDMSEEIEIKFCDGDKLIYTKNIKNFSFEHEITIRGEGIDWLLRFDPLCTNHSIGLALPFCEEWYDFSKNSIKENIANYSNFFNKSLYADQHLLNVPCISSDNIAVFGDMKNNYQFFKYKDGDSNWVRITTSSNPTDKDPEICIRPKSCDIRSLYVSKFPETYDYIYKWKTQFKNLGKNFDIDIAYQLFETELTKEGITFLSKSPPAEKDLERFYPILKKELEKYPASFFAKLNIKHIQLVTDLWIRHNYEERKIDGRLWTSEGSGIIFDMKAPISVIHHEIFHGIQQKKKFYNMPGELYQISDNIQISGISEYLAEMFAMLMTNPGKVHSPDSEITSEQINYLKEGVKEFLNFPNLSSNSEKRKIFAVTQNDIIEIEFGDIYEKATRYMFNKEKLCQ